VVGKELPKRVCQARVFFDQRFTIENLAAFLGFEVSGDYRFQFVGVFAETI
jgi:hypothetical protein